MAGSITRVDRPKPWLARYRGPDGREHSKTHSTKREAERWLTAELSKSDRGVWVDPSAGMVTFGEWAGLWLAGLDLKPSTRANYESNLRARILPTFDRVPLARITPGMVREWLARLRDDGLAPASVRQARTILHAALETATGDQVIGRNPVDTVKAPKVRPRRQLFLTGDQLGVLAEAAEARQPNMGLLVELLGWSGIRWGEAVALRGGRVDVARRRLRIAEAVTEVGGRLEWGTPKSGESRTVVAPGFIVDRLQADPEALVFTAPAGGPLRVGNFRRDVWHPACKAAGMPEGLMVHDLRDTAASLMISTGATIKTIQRQLGHASAALTLDTYGGLYPDDLDALADRLEARHAEQGRNRDAEIVHFPR